MLSGYRDSSPFPSLPATITRAASTTPYPHHDALDFCGPRATGPINMNENLSNPEPRQAFPPFKFTCLCFLFCPSNRELPQQQRERETEKGEKLGLPMSIKAWGLLWETPAHLCKRMIAHSRNLTSIISPLSPFMCWSPTSS